MQEKTEVQRGSVTCPGPQLNYSLRTESEKPQVSWLPGQLPQPGGPAPTAHEAMSRSPQLPSSPHPLILYWLEAQTQSVLEVQSTKPALFNTDFSYLGWRINSTIIKSIKCLLDFFRDASKAQVGNQKVFWKTRNRVCCVEISLNLKNTPVPPSSTSWIL